MEKKLFSPAEEEQNKVYSNPELIAFLDTLDFQPSKKELTPTGFIKYHYKSSTELTKAVNDFFDGSALVNARRFADALKRFRGVIKEMKRSGVK